jgi:hypothetical protein
LLLYSIIHVYNYIIITISLQVALISQSYNLAPAPHISSYEEQGQAIRPLDSKTLTQWLERSYRVGSEHLRGESLRYKVERYRID